MYCGKVWEWVFNLKSYFKFYELWEFSRVIRLEFFIFYLL